MASLLLNCLLDGGPPARVWRILHQEGGAMAKKLKNHSSRGGFSHFAKLASCAAGHPGTFGLAVAVILVWAVTGPLFGFSDTWQLVINTGTTIVTFLMVFLIQNTQNRDSQAMQLKLDEIIRATRGAHTAVMDLEELTDAELSQIKTAYSELAEKGRLQLRKGKEDTGTPSIVIGTFDRRPGVKS
jgi:low affinity Fe/Cu permease